MGADANITGFDCTTAADKPTMSNGGHPSTGLPYVVAQRQHCRLEAQGVARCLSRAPSRGLCGNQSRPRRAFFQSVRSVVDMKVKRRVALLLVTVFSPRRVLSRALVVLQTSSSLVLVAGTGIMVQSFTEMERSSGGYESQGVMTLRVSLPASALPEMVM